MNHTRAEAIVLAVMDYRESDRLVTLLTSEYGKIRGIARGAKRSVRRFGGALELFARLSVDLVQEEGLSRLNSADVVTVFPGIRAALEKIALAGYACELVETLTHEGMACRRIFRLLSAYLDRLNDAPPDPSDRRFFEMNLLNILGYRPPLDTCFGCGSETGSTVTTMNGMIYCEGCGGGVAVSAGTLILLRQSLRTGRFGVLSFSPDQYGEAGHILEPLIAAHLVRPLKSLAFLREIGG